MPQLTTSTAVGGVVVQAPADLLSSARRTIPGMSLDEYTLARVISSEFGSGSRAAQLALADADCNRAESAGRTVTVHATGGTGAYGSQGVGGRPVSTARDPSVAHGRLAVEVLSGGVRGISRGATHYFDARAQWYCHSNPNACKPRGSTKPGLHQHPLAVLESWCFRRVRGKCGMDASGRYVCAYGPRMGELAEWVGQIAGINPFDLMLLRPSPSPSHAASYAAARKVIEAGIAGVSQVYRSTVPALALVVGLAYAVYRFGGGA